MADVGSALGFVVNQDPTPTQAMPGPLEALVVSADATGVRVTIPAFHPEMAFGPAKYSWPVQGFPPVGTQCLVGFVGTDLTLPWIMAWSNPPQTPLRLPGAPAPTRFVGGTTSGPPTTGTFAAGDVSVDQTGLLWVCRTAGTPGGWRSSQDKPVGDLEPTIRSTPKPNTLFLQGQAVSRTTYAALWAFAQAQNLVTGGLFTAGDGSSTFGLPDFRGKVLTGAGRALTLGALVGADSTTLSVAQLPVHGHSVSVADHATHYHNVTSTSTGGDHNHGGSSSTNTVGDHQHPRPGSNFYTNTVGDHGGHRTTNYTAGPGASATLADNQDRGAGSHSHTVAPGDPNGGHNHTVNLGSNAGGHTHTGGTDAAPLSAHAVTQSDVGSGAAIDNRPASLAINYLIWV